MMLRTSAAFLAGGGGADVLVMGVKMLHESAAAPAAASASRTDVVGKEPPGREYLQDLEDEFVAGAVDPPSTSAKMTVGTRTAPPSAKKKIVRSSVTTPTATASAASDGAEAGGSEKQAAGARSDVDHVHGVDDDVSTGRATPTRSFIDEENQFDDVDDVDNLHVHSAGEEVSDSELVAVRPEASSTRAGATPSGSVVSRAATAPEQPVAVGGHAEADVEGVDSPSSSLTANASSSTPAPGFSAPLSTTSTHGTTTSTTGVVRVEKSRKRPAWLNSVAGGRTGTPAASTTTDTGSTDMKTVRRESVVADAAAPPLEEEDVSDFIVEFGGQKDPVPPEIQLQSTLDRLVRKQKQHVLAEGQQDQESSLSSENGKGGIAKGRSENVDGMFALAEFDEAPKEQKAHRSPTETLPVIPPAESASSSLWLFAACGFIVSLLLLVRDQNYVRMRDHVANRVEAAACAWSLRSTSRSSDCISQWPIARTLCPGAGDAGDDDDDVDDEHEDVEDFESSTSAGGMVVRTTSSGNKSKKTSGVRARSQGKKKKTSAAWQAQGGQEQETSFSVERTHQAKGTPGAAAACRNSTKSSDQSKTSSLITNMLPPILQRWNRSRSSRKTSTPDQPGHFEHSEGGARHNFPPDDEQQKLLFRLRNVDVVAASLLRDSVEQQSYDCLLSAPLAAEAGGRVCRVEGRIVLVGGPQGQGEHGDDEGNRYVNDARNVGRKIDETPASIPSPFTDTKCVFWEASVREEGSERTLGFDVGAARTLAVGRKAAGQMGIQLDDAAGTIINLSQPEAISLVLQSRFLERVAATEDINFHRPAFQPAVRQRSSPRRRAAEQGSRVAKATAFVAQYGSATDYGSNVDDASTLDLEQREFDHEEQLHGCSSLMYDEVSLHDSFESTSPSALASGSTSRSQSCNAALLLKESCLHEGMRVTAVGEVRLLENGQLGLFGETMSTNLNGSSTRRSASTVDAEGGFTSWENRACFQNTTSNNGGAVGGCTVTSQIIVSDIGVGNSRDADVAGRDGGEQDEDEPRPWLFPWRLAHTPHSTRGAGKTN